MREIPLLLNGPMVRAVLEGRKTVTRRIVTPAPYMQEVAGTYGGQLLCFPDRKRKGRGLIWPNAKEAILEQCPYGHPGDRLWVRETFVTGWTCSSDGIPMQFDEDGNELPATVWYRASSPDLHWVDDDGSMTDCVPWKPSIHMPRWASRITLEVTSVRVERLREITDAQCIAEGCAGGHGSIQGYNYNASPLEHFRHVWASTGGDWGANPWVWAVEFRRIEQERKGA